MKAGAKSRGMTLVELIITIAIFGGFTLLLTVLVVGSIRNYSRGRVYQSVRTDTSDLVKKMAEEIKLAYILPTLGTSSWIPSGVVVPHPYASYNNSANAPGDIGNGVGNNQVIMIVPRENVDNFDIEDPMKNGTSDPPQVKFVEYLYTVENGVKRIRRNTYSIPKPGSTETYGPYKRDASKRWMILGQMPNRDRSDIILELTEPNDQVWFEVKRPQLAIPGELSYSTLYDRHLMGITARMTRYVRGDTARPIAHEETTQVQTQVK